MPVAKQLSRLHSITWKMLIWIILHRFCLHVFISLKYILRSEIAESYKNSMFNTERTTKVFSKAITPFYLPSCNVWRFAFPTFSFHLFCLPFVTAPLLDVESCSIVVLIWNFLSLIMLSIFHVLLRTISFWRNFNSNHVPIFN